MSYNLNGRDILKLTTDDLWNIPDGNILLQMDDGVLETTKEETVFSAYFWIFHKLYPKTPLLKKHHIGNRILGSNTHAELFKSVMFDCYETYNKKIDMEVLTKIVYETLNKIYNDFTYKLEAYVSTISIFDFIEVVENEEIKEVKANIKPNQHSIDEAYKKINAVLKDKDKLVGNAIAKAAKSGLVSIDQIDQCVGIRGYISDIDSYIFKIPILRGYVEGIVSLYDKIVESRSAAKALMYTKDPLKAVEYFNRQIQILCATFKNVHPGDCKSNRYLNFTVRSSDLDSVVGKYYLDETENKVKMINSTDRHLIGKNLKLRSVFFCNDKDRHGCCQTCFGDLFLSMPRYTNQGQASAIVLGEKASQNVMSTKHLDGSSKVDAIELSDFDLQYIEYSTDPNLLKISSSLANKKVRIKIPYKEAKGLPDVNYVKDVNSLIPQRISQLIEVGFIYNNENNEEESVMIPISIGNRLSSMTKEFLHYIKIMGWSINKENDYEIDLDGWDFTCPAFELPMRHLSMHDHMKSVDSFIKSPLKSSKKLNGGTTVDEIFYQLYKLTSTKIRFNIAHLEVILFSNMITSYENRDFDLPTNADHGVFNDFSSTMKGRSMSTTMAYQGQTPALIDPSSFVIKRRPDHMFDSLLMG
jgi:hypothetical protein